MAYIKIVLTTQSSISVKMASLDSSYEHSDRICSWYLDGVFKGKSFLGASVSSGGLFTFSGLSAGTSYSIFVSISSPNMQTRTFSVTATTQKKTVSRWSWSASNGSATAAETQRSYNSLFNNGNVSDFSYKVWNDLCDKTYEAIEAAGSYWNTRYTTFSGAKMSSSNKVLTAEKFNSLRLNIGGHVSTGIQEVSSGDVVYGWYFTTLARCLNEWINSL